LWFQGGFDWFSAFMELLFFRNVLSLLETALGSCFCLYIYIYVHTIYIYNIHIQYTYTIYIYNIYIYIQYIQYIYIYNIYNIYIYNIYYIYKHMCVISIFLGSITLGPGISQESPPKIRWRQPSRRFPTCTSTRSWRIATCRRTSTSRCRWTCWIGALSMATWRGCRGRFFGSWSPVARICLAADIWQLQFCAFGMISWIIQSTFLDKFCETHLNLVG